MNCAWCEDTEVFVPATHFYRDRFGNLFGLCDDDSEMLQGDEDLTPEDKVEYSFPA